MTRRRRRGDLLPAEPARRARAADRGDRRRGCEPRSTIDAISIDARAPRRAVRRSAAQRVRGRARHALRAATPPTSSPSCVRASRGIASSGRVRRARGRQRLAIVNGGTIPDRGLYGVFLGERRRRAGRSSRVGELDEEMVFELREGEVFLLGASSWRVGRDHPRPRPRHARARASRARCRSGTATAPGARARSARASARSRDAIAERRTRRGQRAARKEHDLDRSAATNLVAYVREQVRGDRRGAERRDHRRRALRRRDRRLARVRPHAVRHARARAVGDRRRSRGSARRVRGDADVV